MNTLTSHTEDYESKSLTELKAICSNVGVSIYGTKKAILNRLVKNGTIKLKPTIEVNLTLNSKKDDIVSACRRRNLPVTGNKSELLARVKNFDAQQGLGKQNNQKVTIQKVHLGERTNGNNGNVLKRVYKHSDPLSVGGDDDISIIVDEDDTAAKRRKIESPKSFESVLSGIFEKKNDSILPDAKEKIVTMETDPERFDESGNISLKEGLNIRRWASDKYFDVKINLMDVGDVVKDIQNKFEDVSSVSNQTISQDHSVINVETNYENGLLSSKDLEEDSCIILNHEKNESNSQMDGEDDPNSQVDAEDDPLSNEITCDDPLANEVITNDPLWHESDEPKINEDILSQINNNIDSQVKAIDDQSEEGGHFIGPSDDDSKTANTTAISTGDKVLDIELVNEDSLGNETTEIIIIEDRIGTITSEIIDSSKSESDSANAESFQSESDSVNVSSSPNRDSENVANSQSSSDTENDVNSPSKSDFEIDARSPCKNDSENVTVSAKSPSKNYSENVTVSAKSPSKVDSENVTVSARSPSKNYSENVTFSPSKSDSEIVTISQSNSVSENKENYQIEESESAESIQNDEHLNLETPESNSESDNYEVSQINCETDNYRNEDATENEITTKDSDEKDLGDDKDSKCDENDDNQDSEGENSNDSDNESTASDTDSAASDNEDSDEDIEMEEPEEENDETVVSVCSKKSEITFNSEKLYVNGDIIDDILSSIVNDATEETKIKEIKPIKTTFFAFGLFVTSSGSAEKVKFVA